MRDISFDEEVTVRAPCSTSNLGPGFDVCGLALDAMYDVVTITPIESKEVIIEIEGEGADTIPTEPTKNTVGTAALQFMRKYPVCGYKIRLAKGIPPISGLGSSGASAAATTVAIDHLLGTNLTTNELIDIARKSELAAWHADNVAPAICGGFVIIRSYQPLDVLTFPPPEGIEFALAFPEHKVTTEQARAVVPQSVELPKVVHNLGAICAVVAGLLLSDPAILGAGLNEDQIVEPHRGVLFPGYFEAKAAALAAGAFGVNLSGAGPTVIAVCDPNCANASEVAKAMGEVFEAEGLRCRELVARPTTGAVVV